MRYPSTRSQGRIADDIVMPLAFTRAGADMAYTKLDLMDREAVEGFFDTHDVESGS